MVAGFRCFLRLEALESQADLIKKIQSASEGIIEARKSMTALGAAPSSMDMQHILVVEIWQHLNCHCSCSLLKHTPCNDNGSLTHAPTQAEPFVSAFKKHMRVATNLSLSCHSVDCIPELGKPQLRNPEKQPFASGWRVRSAMRTPKRKPRAARRPKHRRRAPKALLQRVEVLAGCDA